MQHDIAQFLLYTFVIARQDGVCKFVSLFNRELAQAFVGLFHVPWAFLSQFINNIQEP